MEKEKDPIYLGIDIGNTHTVIGLFAGKRLLQFWRIRTQRDATCDEVWVLVSQLLAGTSTVREEHIRDVIISCVVPPLLPTWKEVATRHIGTAAMVIGTDTPLGIGIRYKRPYELGADRLVNAVAAYSRYRRASIVVDYGTATTFDCISGRGEYLGGAIAPGIWLSAEALFQGASKLPRVDLHRPPEERIAQDTSSAMQVGIIYGFAGLTDRLVEELSREFREKPVVVATGGLARVIGPFCNTIEEIRPELTLEGIAEIYTMLRGT